MNTEIQTILHVTGMRCSSCIRRIDQALRALQGVGAVEVRLREQQVQVAHDPARASVAALVAALREQGYEAAPGSP
jgi:copper chaperone CopZ